VEAVSEEEVLEAEEESSKVIDMKGKITFELESPNQIRIMLNGKEVGQVFAPADTKYETENTIQICGFDEAFNYWGCGIFGEKVPSKVDYEMIPMDAPIYQMREDDESLSQLVKEKYFKKEGGFWYRREIHPQRKMKRDIQLRFNENSSRENHMEHLDIVRECMKCYCIPCTCETKLDSEIPFRVKRV